MTNVDAVSSHPHLRIEAQDHRVENIQATRITCCCVYPAMKVGEVVKVHDVLFAGEDPNSQRSERSITPPVLAGVRLRGLRQPHNGRLGEKPKVQDFEIAVHHRGLLQISRKTSKGIRRRDLLCPPGNNSRRNGLQIVAGRKVTVLVMAFGHDDEWVEEYIACKLAVSVQSKQIVKTGSEPRVFENPFGKKSNHLRVIIQCVAFGNPMGQIRQLDRSKCERQTVVVVFPTMRFKQLTHFPHLGLVNAIGFTIQNDDGVGEFEEATKASETI
mmetsp:Transcript_6075/g.10484  ORF Transcript_6075/g.10484 Transcript_6075/m.10484 type:complete len:271 (-) Transcript_6075:243-1055(-)